MNEGIFPVKKVAPSLIPYNLRKGFDLSTTEHQDSIYAYYFYRLINRAKTYTSSTIPAPKIWPAAR